MAEAKGAYDTRKYVCCAPYYGKQGPEYTRRFRPEFVGALHGHQDKFSSLWEHLHRVDYGAIPLDPNAAQVPHPAGSNALRQESELAYATRSKKLYSLIWTHVEDIDIRARLEGVPGDGLAAWAIVEAVGQLPTTGLTRITQDTNWTNIKLSDVGQTEATIVRFMGHVNRVNNERMEPYNEEQKRLRFLSCITFPTLLRDKAAAELQRPSYCRLENGIQVPDLRQTVDAFDELWRLLYARGEIKYVAPPRTPIHNGQSVVAMCATDANGNEMENQEYIDEGAFIASMAEDLCFNCLGAGHRRVGRDGRIICPSPKKDRNIAHIITALQSMQEAQSRGKSMLPPGRRAPSNSARQRFFARRRSGGRGGRGSGGRGSHGAARLAEHIDEHEAFLAYIDEDGQVYAHDDDTYLGKIDEKDRSDNTIKDTMDQVENNDTANVAISDDHLDERSNLVLDFEEFALVAQVDGLGSLSEAEMASMLVNHLQSLVACKSS